MISLPPFPFFVVPFLHWKRQHTVVVNAQDCEKNRETTALVLSTRTSGSADGSRSAKTKINRADDSPFLCACVKHCVYTCRVRHDDDDNDESGHEAYTRACVRPSVCACVAKRVEELVHVSYRREVMMHLPISRRDVMGWNGTGRDEVRRSSGQIRSFVSSKKDDDRRRRRSREAIS